MKTLKQVPMSNRGHHSNGLPNSYKFYEFFAGGGMARAGLGNKWKCLFANDFDPIKASCYIANWGPNDIVVEDVNLLTSKDLPGHADLSWASFPCQDLSLAGSYAGMGRANSKLQNRSGTFWPYWQLMQSLLSEGRQPKIMVLENVYGLLTSNRHQDFSAVCTALADSGYLFGAMVIDAKHFLPQSRPRIFIVGVSEECLIELNLISSSPLPTWHPKKMIDAYSSLSSSVKQKWLWWNLPQPNIDRPDLTKVIEENPVGVTWHTKEETSKLIGMMSPLNLEKLRVAKASNLPQVGFVYKRIRIENGVRIQRAEVRFDGIAGCLRTPTGGSSRQIVMVVNGRKVRSRLLSPREAARLMGLPESYTLPKRYNDSYKLAGDGVAVPVVKYLAANLLEPLLMARI